MRPCVILFEDHGAEDFRPLSWSLPVYELRCGLFSLRERVALAAAAPEKGGGTAAVGLLPRRLLLPLQQAAPPAGVAVGVDACLGLIEAAGGALCLNARLGPCWELIDSLFSLSSGAEDWAWREGDSLLACRLGRAAALTWLDHWAAWDADTAAAGYWTRGGGRAGLFRPLAGLAPLTEMAAVIGAAGRGDCPPALAHLWDLVPALGPAIKADVERVVAPGRPFTRAFFGIVPEPEAWPDGAPWARESRFARLPEGAGAGAAGVVGSPDQVWLAPGARLDPNVVLDVSAGPIVLDRDARVQPFSYLQGPLYVGAATLIKSGCRLYGETSIGAVCKLAGEVAESVFFDFGNKQHDGFIGHAVVGSWVNLGAGTDCSDLKNNYGPVRVDYGLGPVDTGLTFLGVMMGEHSKSAIGTLFNTGTSVGFASNVFSSGFPPKYLPNFTWGDPNGPAYAAGKAAGVARTVFGRRGCRFTDAHAELFRALARPE